MKTYHTISASGKDWETGKPAWRVIIDGNISGCTSKKEAKKLAIKEITNTHPEGTCVHKAFMHYLKIVDDAGLIKHLRESVGKVSK